MQGVTLRRTQDEQTVYDVRLREAIKAAIDDEFGQGGYTKLAERLGVKDSTVYRWVTPGSGVTVSLDRVVEIENELKLPHGHLLRAGGYVAPDADVTLEQMIQYDNRLSARQRTNLLDTLRSFVMQNITEESAAGLRLLEAADRAPRKRPSKPTPPPARD